MIRIFDIKNSKNDLKRNDNEIFKNYLTESGKLLAEAANIRLTHLTVYF